MSPEGYPRCSWCDEYAVTRWHENEQTEYACAEHALAYHPERRTDGEGCTMRRTTDGQYRHKGWIISRGSYSGTPDDCASGWYIDADDTDTWDRRGPGYPTLSAARDVIDEMEG